MPRLDLMYDASYQRDYFFPNQLSVPSLDLFLLLFRLSRLSKSL